MKRIILLVACCMTALSLNAQRATDEDPYGLQNSYRAQAQNAIVLTAPDLARVEREDSVSDQHPGPLRYAYPISVNFTPENSGVWQQLSDGSKIWRLKVNIPGALSTNTHYDKFWLPDGGKFFVYSEDTRQSIGAVISEFTGGSRIEPIEFATALIYGENVVYEYYQPSTVKESPIILISNIGYGYRYINSPYNSGTRSFGDANPCNININCSEGSNWQMEKHAEARVSIELKDANNKTWGYGWCSCALVNNTTNDKTPYVLTADHCLFYTDQETGVRTRIFDAMSHYTASGWVFYWEYEHPGCNNLLTAPTQRTSTGATLVANNEISDFALLKINSNQDPKNISGVTPYYLGWDRSGNAGASGVGIHHPMGDVKKISQTNSIQTNSSSISWTNGAISLPNTLWNATFHNGFIEGGSSGSPLINNSKRLIGQLYGGPAATCNTNYVIRYGRFDVSWTGSTTSTPAADNRRRLNTWLDPVSSNPTTLNGIGYNIPVSIFGSDEVCSSGSSFYLVNPPSGTIYWTVSNTSIFTVTSSGNPTTVTRIGSSMGNVTLSAHTDSTNGPIVATKTITPCPPPPIISGPSIVCNGSTATYTIENLPAGANTNWTKTGNEITITNTTNNTATISVNSSTKFYASVGASISSGGNTFNLQPKSIQGNVADHKISEILSGDRYNVIYTVSATPNGCSFNGTYEWYIDDFLAEFGSEIHIRNSNTGTWADYVLMAVAKDNSGNVEGYTTKGISLRGFFLILFQSAPLPSVKDNVNISVSIYPNPTYHIINIEINEDVSDQEKRIKSDLVFDMRLYDSQGNLLRQAATKGGTVQFNVSILPNGIYYLHIYDGVNNTPIMKQILVEH